MMNTYIALFRGINVGGNHILPMKELSKLLEGIGCENVQTYIQSGNVVFRTSDEDSGRLAGEISQKISEDYGFAPKIFLMESADLLAAVEHNPFKTEEGRALHFFFLESQPETPDLERLITIKSVSEDFKLHNDVFYLYAPEGIGRSKLAASVGKSLGVSVTARNWNTIRKLVSMVEEP